MSGVGFLSGLLTVLRCKDLNTHDRWRIFLVKKRYIYIWLLGICWGRDCWMHVLYSDEGAGDTEALT